MKRVLAIAPFVPWVVVAAFLLSSTAFAFLQTDDFCTFGRVVLHFHGNPFADVAHLYQHWTGRYSASLLVAAVAASSGLLPIALGYSCALALLVGLFAWACVEMSRLLDGKDARINVAWALVAFCTTLVMMPSKLEQFLWLTGSAVYFAGASLFLVLLRTLSAPPTQRRHEMQICILVAIITGFNEFLAVLTGAALALSLLTSIAQRQPLRPHLVRFAVFALAFSVTVFAPGNFARDAASVGTRHQFGATTVQMLADLSEFVSAFPPPGFAIGLAGAIASGMLGATRGAVLRRGWWLWEVLLLASFPLHLWMYSFLTGESTPDRVINQAFTLSSTALCIVAAASGQLIMRKWPSSPRFALLAVGLAGLGFSASRPFLSFADSLRGYAPRWHALQLERDAGLRSLHRSPRPVYVRPFPYDDLSISAFRGGDVGHDPANWVNRCVADYYQVDSIILMRRQPAL